MAVCREVGVEKATPFCASISIPALAPESVPLAVQRLPIGPGRGATGAGRAVPPVPLALWCKSFHAPPGAQKLRRRPGLFARRQGGPWAEGLLSLRQGLLARSQGLLFLWLRDRRTAMERAREGPRKTAADFGSATAAGLPARPTSAGQGLQMRSWVRALRQIQHLAPRAALTTRPAPGPPVRPGSQALGPVARCDNLGSDADLKHEQHCRGTLRGVRGDSGGAQRRSARGGDAAYADPKLERAGQPDGPGCAGPNRAGTHVNVDDAFVQTIISFLCYFEKYI